MPSNDLININIFAVLFTMAMGLFTLILPRKYALTPLLLTACYMTLGQQFIIVGLHFTFLRVIIFFGWIRLFSRNELKTIELNAVDKAILFWCLSSILLGTLLEGSFAGFINRLGKSYDALGLYFLFRFLIDDFKNIDKILATIIVISLPLCIAMFYEHITARNLFAVFGGVPEFTMIRDGKMRCQGPFRHPILAGTFGATLAPLFFSLYFKPNNRRFLAIVGVASAIIITLISSSSGPLMTLLIEIVGLAMWSFRWEMRYLRWTILIVVSGLHMIMQAPVWFLIARLGDVTGGTAWHRAELIDTAIEHFNEWWLLGTLYTKHWMPYDTLDDPNMIDITNQYIREGVTGGVFQMILFIIILIICFKVIGRAMRVNNGELLEMKVLIWCIGVSLVGHVVSFISVAYFDQIIVFWYLALAIIATLEHINIRSSIDYIDKKMLDKHIPLPQGPF